MQAELDSKVLLKVASLAGAAKFFLGDFYNPLMTVGRAAWGLGKFTGRTLLGAGRLAGRIGDYGTRKLTQGMRFVRRHPSGSLAFGVPVAYNTYQLPENILKATNNVSPENIYRY